MMNELYVIGRNPCLSQAQRLAETLGYNVHVVDLGVDLASGFQQFAETQQGAQIFVALGSEYLNLARSDIIKAALAKGFHFCNLISSNAILSEKVKIGRNIYVGHLSSIGMDVRLGDGVWIDDHVKIRDGSNIGSSAWISAGACVGGGRIGRNTIIGERVVILSSKVGARCVVEQSHVYKDDLADHTYFLNGARTKIIRL